MYVRKQELSKAQVLGSEFEDLYPEIKEVAHGQEIVSVNAIWEQVHSEWRNFESDVMEEIKYLEQATLESCSTSSKGSNRSKISKQSGQSTTNSESQTKIDKYELQKEKAALKVKIAFAKQERELKLAKVHQEQKLEEFEPLREFELNKACVHDEAGYATFSKFASFIREAADKANIPELESLSNSSSPNLNS